MSETPEQTPAPAPAVAQPQVPLPGPLGQVMTLSGLGNAGFLAAAVVLMWTRIEAIEERFDALDARLDTISHEVAVMSTAMQVSAVQQVDPKDFAELQKRVTVIESRL